MPTNLKCVFNCLSAYRQNIDSGNSVWTANFEIRELVANPVLIDEKIAFGVNMPKGKRVSTLRGSLNSFTKNVGSRSYTGLT